MNPIKDLKRQLKASTSTAEKYDLSFKVSELLERSKPKEALTFVKRAYWLSIQENNQFKKVNALILEANILKNIGRYDDTLILLKTAQDISKKIKYKVGVGLILATKGFIDYRKGEQKGGIQNCKKAIKILNKLNNQKGVAKANATIGAVYFGLADYEKAITYSSIAQNIYLKLEDEMNFVIPYFNIAASYIQSKKVKTGLEMIKIGLIRSKKVNNKEIEANFYNLRGAYYFHLSNYESAGIDWSQALKIRIEMESWDYVAMSLSNLGSALLSANQIDKAMELNNLALNAINQIENPHVISTVYSSIGHTKAYLKDFESALSNYQIALKTATNSENKEHQRKAAQDISIVYEQMNDFENALIYYKKFQSLHNEIFEIEKEKIILELEKKLHLKEQETQLLITQNKMLELQKENSTIKDEKDDLEFKVKNLKIQKRFETNNNGIISLDDIIFLEAFGQKTKIHLNNQAKPVIENQILGKLENQLSKAQFFRVHKQYIINGNFLASKNSQRYTLKNGIQINTSRIYKPDLSNFLNKK